LAFAGDGDESAKGREEKSGKMVVLLKSGRGGMVTKPSQPAEGFLSSVKFCGFVKDINKKLRMF
jgi:hypothetical protein